MEMSHNIRAFEQFLHKKGFRITEQRRIILEVLASCGWHLTAVEIYREARNRNRHINLATIYRTLIRLRESGLVQQYYVSPDHSESHFRLVEEVQPIPESLHFHCVNCGLITNLDNTELVETLLSLLTKQTAGFHLAQICMCVEGSCPHCAKATH